MHVQMHTYKHSLHTQGAKHKLQILTKSVIFKTVIWNYLHLWGQERAITNQSFLFRATTPLAAWESLWLPFKMLLMAKLNTEHCKGNQLQQNVVFKMFLNLLPW